jgi:hypothetical protein
MCPPKPQNSRTTRSGARRHITGGLLATCWAFACGGDLNVGFNVDASALPSADTADEVTTDTTSDVIVDARAELTPEASAPVVPGLLPVGPNNPMLLCNDGHTDNWQGEFALLFAANGGPPLVGIVVNASVNSADLDANLAGWQDMVEAARLSGLGATVEPIASDAPVLVRPQNGDIAATLSNGSAGARLIVAASLEHASAELPLVVVTGGRLTDVADAYLLDPTVTERVVVVSSLGSSTSTGAQMGIPNGEMDPWADVIVAQKFRYIQVSSYYDQTADLPEDALLELPTNPFTDWVRVKQPDVWELAVAADQVSVLALSVPQFVVGLKQVAAPSNAAGIPELVDDPTGSVSVVTAADESLPSVHFQQMLRATPATTAPVATAPEATTPTPTTTAPVTTAPVSTAAEATTPTPTATPSGTAAVPTAPQ